MITDHKPLVWLHSVKDPTSRLVQWRLKLAEYEYEVIYKAGKMNVNADALLRNPTHVHLIAEGTRRNVNARMFPLRHDSLITGSNESLFNARSSKPENEPAPTDDGITDSDIELPLTPSDINETLSDIETDSSSDSDDASCIFDNVNETASTKHLAGPKIVTIPDNFITRKDNLVIFTTQQGAPIDLEARISDATRKKKFSLP